MRKLVTVLVLAILCFVNMSATFAMEEGIVQNATLVVKPDDNGVKVQTILQLMNSGRVAKEVAWELPQSVEQLQLLAGAQNVITVNQQKLQLTESLAGGAEATVVYTYFYPFTDDSKEFVLPIAYTTQQFEVLLPEEYQAIDIRSASLHSQGLIPFQGKNYLSFVGSKIIEPSISLQFERESTVPFLHSEMLITWWSESVFRSIDPHLLTAIVVSIVGVISFIVVRSYHHRKKGIDEFDEEEQRFLELYHQHDFLFKKLVELQNKYEAGELLEKEYLSLKEVYKEKLITVYMELEQYMT